LSFSQAVEYNVLARRRADNLAPLRAHLVPVARLNIHKTTILPIVAADIPKEKQK